MGVIRYLVELFIRGGRILCCVIVLHTMNSLLKQCSNAGISALLLLCLGCNRPPTDASVQPAVEASPLNATYFLDGEEITLVDGNAEVEADPDRMTLQMKTWIWSRTLYNDDTIHTPNQPEAFTLTFTDDRRLRVTTDCNNMQGGYEVTDKRITFSEMISTRMFCDGSQEQLFAGMLDKVSSYFFDSRGRLILELKYDSGSMIFR